MSSRGIYRLGSDTRYPGRPSMIVVGCGGAGCNMLARATERGWDLGHHVAVNTDAQHLLSTCADSKVLLGRRTTGGRGANNDLATGEAACKESQGHLEGVMAEADIVVILAGQGGGTGSGAAPVVAEMARRRGSMAISLSTAPFSVEGSARRDNALVGVENLAIASDVSVVLPNDRLLEGSPSLSLVEAFKAADEALLEPVLLLQRMLTRDDLARLRTALRDAGAAHLGAGESNRRRGYGRAVDDALGSLHPPVASRECGRALVLFHAGTEGPDDAALVEMVRSVHLSMSPGGRTLWGVHRAGEMEGRLRAVVLMVRTPKR
jgi:cell division protein FtsZ